MKVALVHDWLVTYAGSERVLAQILKCFPSADLYAVIDHLSNEDRNHLSGKFSTTTFIQKLPFSRRLYKLYLPFMPLAIEQLDLSAYDLVISSSHAVAKGVLTRPHQLHVCYVHSPMRYAWDLQTAYLQHRRGGVHIWLMRWLLQRLRAWDQLSAARPDLIIANSNYIAARIQKTWRRPASVVYPPVDVDGFSAGAVKDDFYLCACRLVTYKRVDLVVEAFRNMPERHLIVIGDGPEMKRLREINAPNVTFLGWQPFNILHQYLQRARAFVFAGEEDFGILPVEAQACGTPVIGFGRGGLLETVRPLGTERPTGLFFMHQSPASLQHAIVTFEEHTALFSPAHAMENAARFNDARFREEFKEIVMRAYHKHATPDQTHASLLKDEPSPPSHHEKSDKYHKT